MKVMEVVMVIRKVMIQLCVILFMLVVVSSFTYGTEKDEYKVVGYYSGSLFDVPVEELQADKLTHIMYAFLIPTDDGGCRPVEKPEQLKAVVEHTHKNGAKVYIAIGGWSYQGIPLVTTFEKIAGNDGLRAAFVKSVVDFVTEYNLDGAELDWEHPAQNTAKDYENLVLDLADALKKKNKNLTAALNGAWSTTAGPETSSYISQACLDAFEFICIMGYDMNNEDHSPFWFANTSIDYWLHREVPAEKIVIGLPLYARPSWMQYRHLVQSNPQYAYMDYAATQPLESYYNGLDTLCKKTVLAYEKAGGVMLFDVNEDILGEYSVVSMIDDTVKQIKTNGYLMGRAADAVELNGIKTAVSKVNDIDLYFVVRDDWGVETKRWIYMAEKPVISNNRTLVPIRVVSAKMGFDIKWNSDEQSVTIVGDGKEIVFIISSDQAVITTMGQEENPEFVKLDCPAQIIKGRTMVPLRFISENLGHSVEWNADDQDIVIHLA